MGDIKNYGKSNRDKLLNLAKQTKGTDYNLILLRFVQERFLYRLSLSAYRENFFLKGGGVSGRCVRGQVHDTGGRYMPLVADSLPCSLNNSSVYSC